MNEALQNQFNETLDERIHFVHSISVKIAIATASAWVLLDYFLRFDNDLIAKADLSIAILGVFALVLLLGKNGKRRAKITAFVYALGMTTICAYVFNTLKYHEFVNYNLNYTAVFVGLGMFLLWDLKYSIILVANAIILNLVFYNLNSPLSIDQYLNGGGILLFSIAIFMIFAINLRFKLVEKEIRSSILLQHSEEKAHQLLLSANDGVITTDHKMQIVIFNPAAEEIFGVKTEHVLGKSLSILMPEDKIKEYYSREFLARQLNKTANKEKDQVFGKRADGTIFPMDLSISKMQFNGEFYMTSIIRDVTVEIKIKNDLIEAKKLAEESKQMQSRFLSNMSHEIRTPMNGVIGMAKLLSQTELDTEQGKLLETIQVSAENLLVVINDILDFSKIEAGKMTLEKIQFNILDRIRVVEEIILFKAAEKDLKLAINFDPDIPKALLGDPVRLNQILLNLLGNAIKFTAKGTVELRVQIASKENNHVTIEFSVLDTGIGIRKDKLESIFSSFTQAKLSTTRIHGGTGLGLSISKQLIELQGGEIWVESEEGKGSKFSFKIPYEVTNDIEQHNEQRTKIDISMDTLKGLKVLLVEDHEINQLLATTVLKQWNFDVEVAENGLQAVNLTRDNDYDVVLMDINMPEMDGYEATRQIRKREEEDKGNSKHLPIIAMTASALLGENTKCFQVGMDDYISKPFDSDDLLNKIQHQLNFQD